MKKQATYRGAGVDIDKANLFVEKIKPLIKMTARKEVMSGIGGFGALFRLDVEKFKNPILVSSTDGVGTKLKVAQSMGKHDTVGIDLVAMSVNDVIVQGAEPLFFLDYIATGKISLDQSIQIMEGIVRGCQEAGCALIGGETAEMPGFYPENEYDLAGFCVGIVDADRLIDGSAISIGDRIIGLASSGLHSNGFSLARKVLFDDGGINIHDTVHGLEESIGTALLRPTKIYVKSMLKLFKSFNIKGLVHVTGGGFLDNIPRILPAPCCAVIRRDAWNIPSIFHVIREMGRIEEWEMFRVFNMGIGMIVIASEKEAPDIMEHLEIMGEKAYDLGAIEKRGADKRQVMLT
ncbi:MAG: phosphoribosylformylglycinamidine cyclo-ligase [Pseudomonadota bacterium]